MTFKQIEYFQLVCLKGNISAAADELFISRSVISRTISELEEEFNTQLFERSKNGVTLTESGRILARLFEEYISSYNITKCRIGTLGDSQNTGTLSIGVTPTNAYSVYKKYCMGFLKSYPRVRIITNEYSATEASKYLLNGTVEAFFTPARVLDYNVFGSMKLFNTQIVMAVPQDSYLARKPALGIVDILDLPLGYLNAPMPVESILDSCFGSFGKTPNVVIRTSDQKLLLELTMNSVVNSILPADMISDWKGIKAIPLNFFPVSTHRLVWNKALHHNEIFDTFLQYIKDCNEKTVKTI